MAIFGFILILAGLGLVFWSRKRGARADVMRTTDTSRVGDVASLVAEIRAELPGPGGSGYAEFVELKGVVRCDEPVTGELSGQAAAICETRVIRMVETRHEVRDSQGHTRTDWRKSQETVSQNRQEAPFYLDDDSGRVRVLPAGAKLELTKVVDRFEPPGGVEQVGGGQLTVGFGSFRMAIGGAPMGGHRRTVGYRFEERVLALDKPLYALGELADTADGLVLRKPETKGRPYVLSPKSEQELVQSDSRSARWMAIGGGVLSAIGVVLAVMGLL